eukprot:COSAG03_NODE_354_length_8654_cov_21.040678_7_plen_148_part_00
MGHRLVDFAERSPRNCPPGVRIVRIFGHHSLHVPQGCLVFEGKDLLCCQTGRDVKFCDTDGLECLCESSGTAVEVLCDPHVHVGSTSDVIRACRSVGQVSSSLALEHITVGGHGHGVERAHGFWLHLIFGFWYDEQVGRADIFFDYT